MDSISSGSAVLLILRLSAGNTVSVRSTDQHPGCQRRSDLYEGSGHKEFSLKSECNFNNKKKMTHPLGRLQGVVILHC